MRKANIVVKTLPELLRTKHMQVVDEGCLEYLGGPLFTQDMMSLCGQELTVVDVLDEDDDMYESGYRYRVYDTCHDLDFYFADEFLIKVELFTDWSSVEEGTPVVAQGKRRIFAKYSGGFVYCYPNGMCGYTFDHKKEMESYAWRGNLEGYGPPNVRLATKDEMI